jgi:hypothetical protein
MTKKTLTLLFLIPFLQLTFAQNNKISFTDFKYVKKVSYSEIVGESTFDLSKCNKHYYSKENCTAIISFCDDINKIPLEDYAIEITLGFGTNKNYDDLVQKIKANCTFLKTTDSEYNGFPTKSFYYKHKSGVTFVYKKYIAKDNQVEYYVSIEIP